MLNFFTFTFSLLAFLVACTRLYTPLSPSVGRLVTLYFFYDFYFWTSLLPAKWPSDLKYGPCPPSRDFGSHVSGLVLNQEVTRQKTFAFFAEKDCIESQYLPEDVSIKASLEWALVLQFFKVESQSPTSGLKRDPVDGILKF